jgi:hypothetical protein
MGLRTDLTITCDYKGCLGSKTGPSVISWCKQDVDQQKVPPPEGYQYLITLVFKQMEFWFCCQLCAAKFFLPPGYDVTQRQVVPINPNAEPAIGEPEKKVDWKDLPMRSENSPDNGQNQADGYSGDGPA